MGQVMQEDRVLEVIFLQAWPAIGPGAAIRIG
jgi:hypothetical protein